MDIKQLMYFVQICDNRSFSQASTSLFITQQALSTAIKHLESELGTQLFIRTSKGIQLTESGNYLLEKSRYILNEYEAVTCELKNKFKHNIGTINLCAVPGALRSLSPNILFDFMENHPNILINRFEYPDLICESKVKKGLIDIGWSLLPSDLTELDFTPIKTEKLGLIINKKNPLSKKSSINIEDLVNENFIVFDRTFNQYHFLLSKCREAGFKPNIVFESADVDLLLKLVSLNKGIFMCVKHVTDEVIDKNTCIIPFEDDSFKWEIGFILKKNKQIDPVINTFMDYVLMNSSK